MQQVTLKRDRRWWKVVHFLPTNYGKSHTAPCLGPHVTGQWWGCRTLKNRSKST